MTIKVDSGDKAVGFLLDCGGIITKVKLPGPLWAERGTVDETE